MKPYPRYKSTGLAWLPSVPEHWEIKRLKNLFAERKEANRDGNNTKVLSLLKDVGVVPYEEKGNVGNKSKEDITQYKIARKGDLVLNSMNVIIGSVGVSEYDGCVSPVYYALCPRDGTNAKYYEHLFRLQNVQKTIRGRANGILEIRLRISAGALLDLPFPVPPPAEQSRIVRYLDEKTAAIDDLVRAKEREIGLLRERKQAIVSAAVTGGAAGRGWEGRGGQEGGGTLQTFRLKELVTFFKGLNITKADLVPEGANVISYGQIHSKENGGRTLKDSLLRHTPLELTTESARLAFGDIVFADTSEDQDGIGNCVLNDRHDAVWAGYHTITAHPRDPSMAPFLAVLFQSNWWRNQLRRNSDGVKVYSVTQHSLGNTRVMLPPLPEQRRIVAHLDAVCSQIDAAETAIRKQIALLQEFRTSLISDAVTGAVEV